MASRKSPRVSRPFALTLDHLWLGLPIAIVVWFGFLRAVGPLDFWWHLKAGEIIVTTKSIPRTDLFSFTCTAKPFILQNWLGEVVYYATYEAGGLALIVALNTALLVAALVPVYHLCYRAAGGVRLAVASAFLPVVALLTFGNVRLQAFSFVFFSATYWALLAYRSRQHDLVWTLPFVMLVWVNIHGGFVLGLTLIGLVLASESARRLVHGPRSDTLSGPELRRLAYVLVLCALATLVNPEGYGAYSSVTAVTHDPVSQSFVTEWQRPRLDELGVLGFYAPLVLAVLVLASSELRADLTELVVFVAFAGFAMTAIRNAVWFVLASAPIVARHLPTVGILRSRRRAGSGVASRDPAPVRHGLNAVLALSMAAVAVFLSPWMRIRLSPVGARSLLDPKTPVGAVDYMEMHDLRGSTFSPEAYGDYLVWRLWPRQRSFVDSRVHLFQECLAVANDYNLMFFDSRWEDRLRRYDVTYVLLDKADSQSRRMIDDARESARWRLLYEDDVSVLFERI